VASGFRSAGPSRRPWRNFYGRRGAAASHAGRTTTVRRRATPAPEPPDVHLGGGKRHGFHRRLAGEVRHMSKVRPEHRTMRISGGRKRLKH